MRRMRERDAVGNANGRSRGWMSVFALPSHVARRFGSGRAGGGTEAGGDWQGDGQVRGGRSLQVFTGVAPTQEEEDEEWRNMSLLRRFLKQAFPR